MSDFTPTWENRRRVVRGTLYFIALSFVWLMSPWAETEKLEIMAWPLSSIAGAIVMTYLGIPAAEYWASTKKAK